MKELFGTVVGNSALRTRIGNDVLASKLPHALILEGPRGTGKHTIARLCAAALVCERHDDPIAPLPCLKCLPCRKVVEEKSPDVICVGCQGKATIGVDAVRFLRDDVCIVPNDSEHKVYVIEDADKMTPQAQNALLLTLEEPPSYVHFFLLCENAGNLLETIRSRAPVFRTQLLTRSEVDEYLCRNDRRAAQMKLSDPSGYEELLTSSKYGIGRALEYLEPKSFAPVKQIRALVLDFIVSAINGRGASSLIPVINRFSPKRDLLSEQLSALSDAVRDLILLKKSDEVETVFFSDKELAIELSDKASMVFLYELNTAVQNARDEIGRNANVRLCLIKMAVNSNLL